MYRNIHYDKFTGKHLCNVCDEGPNSHSSNDILSISTFHASPLLSPCWKETRSYAHQMTAKARHSKLLNLTMNMKVRICLLVLGVIVFAQLCIFGVNSNKKNIQSGRKKVLGIDEDVAEKDHFSVGVPSSSTMQYFSPDHLEVPPVVSVITPVFSFNESKIQETVSSVLHQSLQNWEWIIVDDAVEENLLLGAFVRRLGDKRVRVVRDGHHGLSGARNLGIREAKGVYFYPLDDDDLIAHTALELLFFSLSANPAASFCNGFSRGFGSKSYKWPRTYGRPEGFLSENLGTYALMGRKDHWQAVGGYDDSRTGGLEDWDYTLKLMNQGRWGYTVPEYVFWYRTRVSHADRCAVG